MELDNLNDIISSLSQDDVNMLKSVASSILSDSKQETKPSSSKALDGLDLGDIDFNMIMRAKNIFEKMNSAPNKNVDLIMALKPHLNPQTQNKADQALRILKLFEVLPLLKELF